MSLARFGERLANELPHARYVAVPRAGHFPMVEAAGVTRATVRDFLEGEGP